MTHPEKAPETISRSMPDEALKNFPTMQQILIRGALREGASLTEALLAGAKAGIHSKGGALYNRE